MNFTVLIFILCFTVISAKKQHDGKNIEDNLIKHVLKNYNPANRPVHDPTTPVELTFNVKLLKLKEMDERKQQVTVQVMYEASWQNQLLNWIPSEWGNISQVYIQSSKIWKPEVTLINNADDKNAVPHTGTESVRMTNSGSCTWGPKMTLLSFFDVDVQYFPFDIQNCSLIFRPWNMDESQLMMKLVTSEFNEYEGLITNLTMLDKDYMISSEWSIIQTEKTLRQYTHRNLPVSYSQVTFTMVFSRKPWFYIVTAIIPVIILVAIVLFSYFLPANSGERMGVLITVLLAFAVYLEAVTSSLPHNSDSTSILSTFYLVTMAECALSFLGTCLVITLQQKGYRCKSLPPQWMRKLLLKTTSVMCMTEGRRSEHSPEVAFDIKRMCAYDNETVENRNETEMSVKQNQITPNNIRNRGNVEFSCSTTNGEEIIESKVTENSGKTVDRHDDIVKRLDLLFEALNRQNDFHTYKFTSMNDSEKQSKVEEEWKIVAELIDFHFFWFFIISIIAVSVGILIPPYLTHSSRAIK